MSTIKFVNLCPHALDIVSEDGSVKKLDLCPTPARVEERLTKIPGGVGGFDAFTTWMGEAQGIPAPQEGVYFVVSRMVFDKTNRLDVCCPGHLLRDDLGKVVGAVGFIYKVKDLNQPTEIEVSDRGQKKMLFIKDGVIYNFSGKNIPGVVVVVTEAYHKNGKWSYSDYKLKLAEGIRYVEILYDDRNYRWFEDYTSMAAMKGKKLAFVSDQEFLSFLEKEMPKSLEKYQRTQLELGGL